MQTRIVFAHSVIAFSRQADADAILSLTLHAVTIKKGAKRLIHVSCVLQLIWLQVTVGHAKIALLHVPMATASIFH